MSKPRPRTGTETGRRSLPPPAMAHTQPRSIKGRAVGALVLASLAVLCLGVAAAQAAVKHAYLPVPSEAITTSALGEFEAIAGNGGGKVWVAENGHPGTRVDEYDAATGADLGVRLIEEGGVGSLGLGLGVGHVGGEEQVYTGAGAEGQYVVAEYDGESRLLQHVWKGAHTANGSFSLIEGGKREVGAISGVAVDNSANLETAHDVYVATFASNGAPFPEFNAVNVLKPGPGGSEGESAGTILGTCAEPGVCAGGSVIPFRFPVGVAVSGFNGDVVVSDSHSQEVGNAADCGVGGAECSVDVFEPVAGLPGVYSFLFKISEVPIPVSPFKGPLREPHGVAVDAATGNIYVAEAASGVVDEFSPSGVFLGRITGVPAGGPGEVRPFEEMTSVGVEGNVFIGDRNLEKHQPLMDVFGPDVVVPDVSVEAPEGLTPTEVVLRGVVDPLEEGPATCTFQYGVSEKYGQSVPCTAPVPNGGTGVKVSSERIPTLSPGTEYHYRLVATNANGVNTGECPGDCGSFLTPGPSLVEEFATDVSSSSVTLGTRVDPRGHPTSYYFQYSSENTTGCGVGSSSGCVSSPAAPGASVGGGQGPVEGSTHVQGLSPGTTYHYRVVAVSELHAGSPESFPGADRTFTTQMARAGGGLLDGRQWELVSPVNKHGALLQPIEETGVVQAAAGGGAITYLATRPTEDSPHGYAESEQVLSSRGAAGWSSQDLTPAHGGAVGTGLGQGQEYRFFSEDLSLAVVEPFGPFTSLAPEAAFPDSERTPYLRANTTCGTTPHSCYRPLVTGCPPPGHACSAGVEEVADVPAGTVFGGVNEEVPGGPQPQVRGEANLVGATGSLSDVVLSSKVALTPPPKQGETGLEELYEWSKAKPPAAALQLVSIRPDGTLAPGSAQLGYGNVFATGAVSGDGSRVIWSEAEGEKHLYVRDISREKTFQVDVPEAGCVAALKCGEGAAAPVFQFATADGSRLFFTDSQRLVANAGVLPNRRDLYVCDVEEVAGELACKITDLTPVTGSGESADVQGAILGASTDGSTVYFAANGALAEGATHGACSKENTSPAGVECGLYMDHLGAGGWEGVRLVAMLGGEDRPSWAGVEGSGLNSLTARVSPNGRFAAFMSDRPLTGYDTRDAATGSPDQEVYLYDSQAESGVGRVVCASCNPTGARPHGVEYQQLKTGLVGVDGKGFWEADQEIAANVPGWTAFGLKIARHQSRYLSDTGRLFFNSSDALLPRDVNGQEDVYEYEPAGVGSCSEADGAFQAPLGGCVGLVSSGTAAGESAFVDASESGEDVFFLTKERLALQDKDSALDLYDAHVCSAASPCPVESLEPPACTTAESCRAPATPQPSIFGPPPSATFNGKGNIEPAPALSPVKPKAKPPTRAQKLTAALKGCHKKRGKARTACEKAAKRKYGPVEQKGKKQHKAGKRNRSQKGHK
jgi:hypothetical protein